jgi:nucleoside-diphosphate-sugar epimerase
LKGLRIVVTGTGGFVGASLVRDLLERDATVHALTRRETDLWRLRDVLSRLQHHLVDLSDSDGVTSASQQVAHIAEALCGSSIGREDKPLCERPWDTGHRVADVSKTRSMLGWEAPTGLGSGLEKTLTWPSHHLHQYGGRVS